MSARERNFVVATIRPWHVAAFHERVSRLPGRWHLITDPSELTPDALSRLEPRYVFFPHWSHLVPPEVTERFECVGFHETPVPYGRGGSPVQNMIARGHDETTITALRMVEALDAGPVYCRRPLSLHGLGEEIFLRAAAIVADMIAFIVTEEPRPQAQEGEATTFARRKPDESRIDPEVDSLEALFRHLTMLDADGYPRAFLEVGGLRLEFSRAALRTGRIEADVRITRTGDGD